MKRILLSVFAAAVAVAWAAPSNAADVTFSGQERIRTEWRNHLDFDKNKLDAQDFWLERTRLTTNVKATDDTTLKITLQDSRTWGQEGLSAAGGPALTAPFQAGASGGSTALDVHEAYVNIDNLLGAPVALRAGRQELVYGDQRLVGNFDWSNQGRAFDALKVVYGSDVFNVDAWWSKLKEGNGQTSTALGAIPGNDVDFWGLYATIKAIPNNTLDVYALIVRDGNTGGASNFAADGAFGGTNGITTVAAPTGITKGATLNTFGARLAGSYMGFDYGLEVPFQTGSNAPALHEKTSAYAVAAKANYMLPIPNKVNVGVAYNYATGTSKNDTDNKTFFNLFPTNHNKFGIMDLAAWRNISALNLNVSAEPMDKVRLYAAFWNFSLAQADDSWYQAAKWNGSGIKNGSIATGSVSTSKTIGNEFDLVATYKYNNAVTGEVGYGHFAPGAWVKDNVGSTNAAQDFAYLQLTANF